MGTVLGAAADHARGVRGAQGGQRLGPVVHPHLGVDPADTVDEQRGGGSRHLGGRDDGAPPVDGQLDAGVHLLAGLALGRVETDTVGRVPWVDRETHARWTSQLSSTVRQRSL